MEMFYVTDGNGGFEVSNYFEILLDPKAWEAVGKARRWDRTKEVVFTVKAQRVQRVNAPDFDMPEHTRKRGYVQKDKWKKFMLGLVSTLIDGKTTEQYLISIE